MWRLKARVGLIATAALTAGGCNFWLNEVPSPDDLWQIIPWFDHMIQARYIHPYETAKVPRDAVEGTVPTSDAEPDWLAEWSTGKTTIADRLVNPTRTGQGQLSAPGADAPILPATLEARGDSVYETFCLVCHGATGAADGPVSKMMGAPALLTDRARRYTDGYLYSVVRYGRGVMPRYGDKIYSPADRWAVVNHVRKLQAQAPVTPAAPAAGGAPAKPENRSPATPPAKPAPSAAPNTAAGIDSAR